MFRSELKEFLINYIAPFIVVSTIIYFALHFILDLTNTINILNIILIIIQSSIAIIAILSGVLFVMIQYIGQQYSPRILLKTILLSHDTIFMVFLHIVIICWGFSVVSNTTLITNHKIMINIYLSIPFAAFILIFFYFYRITKLVQPNFIMDRVFYGNYRNRKKFIKNMKEFLLKDRVQYPRNIPSDKDLLMHLINTGHL